MEICNKISLAIKNTNWCNLKCAHCCECSGPNITPNIMPLSNVEKYIGEFNAMPLPKWEHMVFTGGETMAPYFHGRMEYIPQCLEIASSYGMVPFVKTNGVWGTNEELRHRILRDFANIAYRQNKLMSLDISVDRFHKNIPAVCNILNDVVRSDYLAPAVRISLAGLNDTKSYKAFTNLIRALREKGLGVNFNPDLEFTISVPDVRAMRVFYDFNIAISNIGRAADNNLGNYVPDGRTNILDGNCLQIDNNDIARLNYKYSTAVNGRSLFDVTKELLAKVR